MARTVNRKTKRKPNSKPWPPRHVDPPASAYQLSKTEAGRATMEARLVAARAFTSTVEDGRASYADMLSKLWGQASKTLEELETDLQMPLKERLNAMQKLARVMPLIAKAQKAHTVEIGGVAVEDMSSAQLEAAVAEITNK